MNLDELSRVLDTHGSNEERWPDAVKAECRKFIAENSSARALLKSQQQLDENLGTILEPAFPGLEQRVLHQPLPQRSSSLLDSFVNWLIPLSTSNRNLWRPVAVACFPLIMGIAVSNFYSFGITAKSDGFQYWDDELLMLSFNDYSETDPLP